jgi:nucleotide sugar dehydrogenase
MAQNNLKIGIIGIGLVGTPLKRYFEEIKGYRQGKNLFLYDIDPKKGFFDDVNKAHAVFVCVPTPRNSDGSANTTIVESALKSISGPRIVIIKSTVPPGTTVTFQKKHPKLKLLFNPEFLTESRAWEDMINPDRQVIGHTAQSKEYASKVLNLLPTAFFSSPGTLGTYTFVRLNAVEAELGKYAGNTFGAFKVTFANVIKDFCDALEKGLAEKQVRTPVYYENVRAMLAHDRRIGDAWLNVAYHDYRGYGGYCFTKDTDALISSGEEMLRTLPKKSIEHRRLTKGIAVLAAMREYNRTLLETQGLTPEDVSVHDHEWIKKKLNPKS